MKDPDILTVAQRLSPDQTAPEAGTVLLNARVDSGVIMNPNMKDPQPPNKKYSIEGELIFWETVLNIRGMGVFKIRGKGVIMSVRIAETTKGTSNKGVMATAFPQSPIPLN